jgi:hypothetical protein
MRVHASVWAAVAVAVATVATVLPAAGTASAGATPASYPTCGTYWNRNTPVSAAERRVNACIVKASREARRARAVAALTTIEGDPIVNYVFVRGARDILVIVDTTRDAFGAKTWSRFRCTKLVVVDGRLGWTGCVPRGTGKPAWLRPVKLRT